MQAASDTLAAALDAAGVPYARVGGDLFVFQLRGERKLTIPVNAFVRERTLIIESFFMRNPIERHEDVFRLLLQRNAIARRVHFALGDRGDVYLVGQMPVAGLDEHAVDELLGEILTTSDETFDAALALGFATYLERDMAWRAKQAPRGSS